ncbi:MAG: hypothetical protein ACRDG4_15285, partial [Chloroflexota bacterium]
MKRLLIGFCALLVMGQGWHPVAPADATGSSPYLIVSTLGGTTGQQVRAVGTGLPATTAVRLSWFRGAPSWQVKDGLFNGIKVGEKPVQIASGITDAQGKVTIPFTVPNDFGYIHNVELATGGKTQARQGFTVIPKLNITPTSGPVGTPITVTFSGVGYSLYESVWHLLYDTSRTGWLSAITTNGTATAVIPATGAVGLHTLQVISGTHPVPYLNQQQAPIYQPLIPTVLGASFRVTAGTPIVPANPATQTLPRTTGTTAIAASGPSLVLSELSGTVGTSLTVRGVDFTPSTMVHLSWSTVVGNRISGNGFASQDRPLADVKADSNGAFTYTMATPDDLGGAHTLTASAGNDATARARYTITPSAFP